MLYVVKVNSENEDKLILIGNILFKSNISKGLYVVDTKLNLSELKGKDYILSVTEDMEGSFSV